MRRAAFLSFTALILLATGLVLRDGAMVALALPIITYLSVGLIQYPRSTHLTLSAKLSRTSASEGASIDVEISVENLRSETAYLLLEDQVPPSVHVVEGSHKSFAFLPDSVSHEYRYKIQALRGFHSFGGLRTISYDPLALFEREAHHEIERTLLIRPSLRRLRHVELQPLRTGVHAGLYRARRGGPGIEFHGVRPYTAGDSRRWINWKASGRHRDTLFINEFEQERAIDIGLIVDARARSNMVAGGRSSFSYSILAAASLSDLFLAQANRVGLMLYGSHLDWTVPGYGRMQRERIMWALARARVGYSRIFDRIRYLPTRLFAPRSQLIFISPVLREDVAFLGSLRARQYPILVISPDRIATEAALLSEEPDLDLAVRLARLEQELLTRSLTSVGIPRVVWDIGQPLEQAIEVQASRPRRWLRAVRAQIQ